jgi:hypothetical protein
MRGLPVNPAGETRDVGSPTDRSLIDETEPCGGFHIAYTSDNRLIWIREPGCTCGDKHRAKMAAIYKLTERIIALDGPQRGYLLLRLTTDRACQELLLKLIDEVEYR